MAGAFETFDINGETIEIGRILEEEVEQVCELAASVGWSTEHIKDIYDCDHAAIVVARNAKGKVISM